MKKIAVVLSVAVAMNAVPLWAGVGNQAALRATIGALSPGLTAFLKDEEDSEEGDPEGGGVVDPTPQDDGSDGVDDGSGDGQPV